MVLLSAVVRLRGVRRRVRRRLFSCIRSRGGAANVFDVFDVFGPGEESGTYDTFVEFAIEELAEERVGEDMVFLLNLEAILRV